MITKKLRMTGGVDNSLKYTKDSIAGTGKQFFNELNSSKSVDEINNLFSKYKLKRKDKNHYPDIKFNISIDEIEILKKDGIITKENLFNPNLSKNINLTALEKILYSIIWKQGDLKKEKHIISGICGINTEGRIFNQFGRYLSSKDDLIIDQHVLRSFIFYKTEKIIKKIENMCFKLNSDDYIDWIKKNDLFFNNKDLIDEIMFEFGKKIKPLGTTWKN